MSGNSSHIRKPHNKTLLVYHIVCPVKYRRDVFTEAVSKSLRDVVKKIKSITAKHIFAHHKEVKTKLWGGNFWTQGYYANTVGNANMSIITNYVQNQGIPNYAQLHSVPTQASLFTT